MPGNRHVPRLALDRRQWQQRAPIARHMGRRPLAVHDRVELARDIGIVVETQHRIGLGELGGELLAITLRHAADRDDRLGPALVLEVSSSHQRVDRVHLGGLDEAAGVDHHRICVLGLVDQPETTGLETSGELFGVDLVARAAEGDQVDGSQRVISHGPAILPRLACTGCCRTGTPVRRCPAGW